MQLRVSDVAQAFGTIELLPPELFHPALAGYRLLLDLALLPDGLELLDHPRYEIGDICYLLWSMRISRPGSSVVGCLDWSDPHRPVRHIMESGPSSQDTTKEVARVRQRLWILQLCFRGPLRGRRQGSKAMSDTEFQQRYPEMYQELLGVYGSKPRQYEVADALGMDADTFRQHRKDSNLPFPPL
jgi:hypothetical protein